VASPRLIPLALLALGLLVSGATALENVQPNDEGLVLAAAERIARGEAPYGDFWANYAPGQYYLLGALRELLGPSLVPWRIVRVLCDAGVAALAYVLARRGGAPPALAAVAWLAAICAMASPSGPNPFAPALLLALASLAVFERSPAAAGALAGLTAFWRLEFAACLAAGIGLGLLLARRRRGAGTFAVTATAVGAILYVPVLARAGIGPAIELLVSYPLTGFRDFQSLPFPLDYAGPLNLASPAGFLRDSAEPLALFYLPAVLVAGLVAAAVVLLPRARAPLVAAGLLTALGPLGYLLARTDLFHTAPLGVLVAMLAAWAIAAAPRRSLAVLPALALAYLAVQGLDRRWLALQERTVALDLAVADGVSAAPPLAAELTRAVRAIRRRTDPGEPIYVAPRRADLVTAGFPLLYVLAQRPNPTRYDVAQPGVVTTAPVQREIVAALDRTRTPLVVRWTDPRSSLPEPNRGGRATGVRLLDRYLERRYRPAERIGSLRLLVRRP